MLKRAVEDPTFSRELGELGAMQRFWANSPTPPPQVSQARFSCEAPGSDAAEGRSQRGKASHSCLEERVNWISGIFFFCYL